MKPFVSLFCGLIVSVASADMVKDSTVQPFDIGNRSQVFVDRSLVRSSEGLSLTLRPGKKHPAGPWLSHKDTGPAGSVVVYDENAKLFKSWSPTSYNTSKDGLRWSEKERNPPSWLGIRRLSVIKDNRDTNPSRRYKLVTFGPSGETAKDVVPNLPEEKLWWLLGYNTYISADGREVVHHSRQHLLIRPDGKAMTERIFGYYDQRLGLFFAFPKTGSKRIKTTLGNHGRFLWSVMTSKDFDGWTGPVPAFEPADQLDDDGVAARLAELRPLMWFPTDPKRLMSQVYAIGGPIQLESCTLILPYFHIRCNHSFDGFSEIQLAVSRDGLRWERPFRQPFIPRGKVGKSHEDSEWDSGWFNGAGPGVEVGDEVWVYYSARNTPHDHPVGFSASRFSAAERAEARKQVGIKYFSGIGLAVWKRDRFVSVDASVAGGSLTTIPVVFTGDRLELNAATRAGGQVSVEILDSNDKLLALSKPFAGDDLRHRVQWETPVNLAAWAGRPVSVRFHLKNADLFAFAFRRGEK